MTGARLLAALVVTVITAAGVRADADSVFSLDDKTLVTRSAVAIFTDEFFGGRTNALKIIFTPDRLTQPQQVESARDDGRALMKKDHAVVVLFLDKQNRISQVNITVIIPGQTVVRTVAWKPDDVRSFSAGYSYDGKRLRLAHKGSLTEATPGMAPIKLGWNINVDAPVVERLKSGNK
jgi:hypothetical protein